MCSITNGHGQPLKHIQVLLEPGDLKDMKHKAGKLSLFDISYQAKERKSALFLYVEKIT